MENYMFNIDISNGQTFEEAEVKAIAEAEAEVERLMKKLSKTKRKKVIAFGITAGAFVTLGYVINNY